MTATNTAVDHPSRRLIVQLPHPYDEARELYEILVPEVDLARFGQMANWQATLELPEINAPQGFMRYYYSSDVPAAMAGSAAFWKATEYLMGNHTIAERMFHHEPAVMLHAPLRTLVYADPELAVDQPRLLFASYNNPDIEMVGCRLDYLLALLIINMGGDVPSALRNAASWPRGSVRRRNGWASTLLPHRARRSSVSGPGRSANHSAGIRSPPP